MALEAVVFAQELFRHSMVGGPWFYDMAGVEEEAGRLDGARSGGADGKSPEQAAAPGELDDVLGGNWDLAYCGVDSSNADDGGEVAAAAEGGGGRRRKRRRERRARNREEVENQRMTHIAVERNRRRQMNEYLAALRSLMPPSYVKRGDQASIVGGAINFVKELEQLLQSLEAQKRTRQQPPPSGSAVLCSPFGGFFTSPQQYSSSTTSTSPPPPHCHPADVDAGAAAAAEVDVTVVESHASLKVLSRRRPRQLLDMVAGLQRRRLTTLHLNVTAVGDLVLYSFSLKVGEDCQLSSASEIAAAVHQMLDSPSSPLPPLQPTTQQDPSSSPAASAVDVTVQRRD